MSPRHPHAWMQRALRRLFVPCCACLAVSLAVGAPPAPDTPPKRGLQAFDSSPETYDGVVRSSVYVRVRDGTMLAVDLFRPARDGVATDDRLPVVWMHTPYNRRSIQPRGQETAKAYPGYALDLVKHGYVVAVADFRGLHASFGRNVGFNRGEWAPAAWWDAYDLTEWFARQPWSSGRVGMWGCSATGGSQLQAAATAPPSLRAIMPMSAEFDAYGFQHMGGMDFPSPRAPRTSAEANAERDRTAAPVDGPDADGLLAAAVASHAANAETVGEVPWRDSLSPVMNRQWWQQSSPSTYLDVLKRSGIGVYVAVNWDEAATKPGSFLTFANLPERRVKLVAGPGTHCQWDRVLDETGFSIVKEELRFFDHWLKGVDNHVMDTPVTYYTYNAPPGSEWRTSAAWPPSAAKATRVYLARGALRSSPPSAAIEQPVMPSPAPRATVIHVEHPQGGVSYETGPLSHDVELTGIPVAHLRFRSNLPDVLAVAWIDDVDAEGNARSYQMLGLRLASTRAVAKAPYQDFGLPWHSGLRRDARPLKPGSTVRLDLELLPMSYVFKASHRIRVTVAFSPPKGMPDEGTALGLEEGGADASSLELPVVGEALEFP